MIVKMLLTLDFDPATGEYKSLKQEIVKEEPTKKVAVEVEDTAEPQVTLDSNKYILNKAAAAMIGAAWGDRPWRLPRKGGAALWGRRPHGAGAPSVSSSAGDLARPGSGPLPRGAGLPGRAGDVLR